MKIHAFNPSMLAILMAASLLPEICFAQTSTNPPPKIWGPETAGQCISIWTPKLKYHRGEEIKIYMSIKNVGTNEVRFAVVNSLSVYDAVVQIGEKAIQPTVDGKMKSDGFKQSGGSLAVEILKPDEEDTVKNYDYHPYYPLSQIYDLSTTGTYKVKLTRKLIDPHPPMERVRVTSNEIEIIVEYVND